MRNIHFDCGVIHVRPSSFHFFEVYCNTCRKTHHVAVVLDNSPFLSIALHHEPMWSTQLLAFIWICAICGISVEAFYPLWIHKGKFSLAMYLGMGWACMACVKDLAEALSMQGIYLLVAGGLGYTGGVPFFVRNNHLDHSIWHCFVMAGSMFHWFCIYYFIVTLDENV